MDKKILILIGAVLTIALLVVQACTFTTRLALECQGEGDIVCSDEGEAYQCQLGTYDIGFYTTRADSYDVDCGAEAAVEGEEAGAEVVTETCSDTDNGEDLYSQGTVTTVAADGTETSYDDSCGDLSTVKEYYCSNDAVSYSSKSCEDGYDCYYGECIVETDTDGDGLSDLQEDLIGTDANDADSDDDGLSDYEEETTEETTDPMDSDSDDDGVSDGDEVSAGTDPTTADETREGITTLPQPKLSGTTEETKLTAVCNGPYTGAVGGTIDFTAAGSTGTGKLGETTYIWNFGDEETSNLIVGVTTHEYGAAGSYTVTLTITNTDGSTDTCETTAEIISAYEVTDLSSVSISGTIGSTLLYFYTYEKVSSSWSGSSMGNLVVNTNTYKDSTGNPSAASPLLIGIPKATYWQGITAEQTVTITLADSSTFDIYLPIVDASVLTEYAMVFYVADDGSTYYADADNNGVESGRGDLLAPEQALTPDHLARAAE